MKPWVVYYTEKFYSYTAAKPHTDPICLLNFILFLFGLQLFTFIVKFYFVCFEME